MNIFKRIWNLFLGKKVEPFEKMADVIIESKVIEHEIILPKYRHKMSFRKQQLVGKTYNTGKDRFRIHERISVANKFKYHIELLT